MTKSPFSLPSELYGYLLSISVRESEAGKLLREATSGMDHSGMQISPDQGQFMAFLIRLAGFRTIVEIGTYTGYSALSMAEAVPNDGKVITCDMSREWTRIGKPFWEQAGVSHKIDLRIGPALETLEDLSGCGYRERVDLVFIDADKENYVNYYEKSLDLLRPGGLVILDNVFWSGAVIDPEDNRETTRSILDMNAHVSSDTRVDISMIAVGDGLFLARKK